MTHTTQTLAPIFETDTKYAGNTNLARLAEMVRGVQNALADGVRFETWDGDIHLLSAGSHLFVTPSDEVVYVSTRRVDGDSVDAEMEVTFPEREAVEMNGDPALYRYTTTAGNLNERMEADGGWREAIKYVYVRTPNCPDCGTFVGRDYDFDGMPFAECHCGGAANVDDLLASGAVRQLW